MANLWLTGTGEPTLGTGEQGDYYRDTVTNLVYFRENPTTWAGVPAFTPSPDGVGTTWLYGTGAPLNGLGSNGNYYFDNDVNTVYFKVLGAWEAKGSLDFIGVYGVQWGNGTGAPANIQPLNDLPAGSFYLDVATSDIYYKNPSLVWEAKGQLGGGGGGGVTVVDNLTTQSTADALSANQGKVLKDEIDTKCPLVEGKVPSANLPSYVDDVLEFDDFASFPVTGESGKIYIASNTNFVYRWTGSAYVLIGDGTSVDVVTVGANAFPRYDAAQSLSTTQKAQLATNMGVFDPTINTQTGTSYTVGTVTTDNDGKTYLRMDNAAANTALVTTAQTLPISVRQVGAGVTTLVADTGVTLNGTLAFTAQYQTKTVIPLGGGSFDVVG